MHQFECTLSQPSPRQTGPNRPGDTVTTFVVLFLITAFFVLAARYGAEDRPHMKRIDVSPARPDTGYWLHDRA